MTQQNVLVPGGADAFFEGLSEEIAAHDYRAVRLGAYTSADIDCGLLHIDNDVCVSTVALVGQCVRALKHQDAHAIIVPQLCRECRSVDARALLELALQLAGYEGIRLIEVTVDELIALGASDGASDSALALKEPVVGVCGNGGVLANPLFYATVCEHLEKSGCQVVQPPLAPMMDDRDYLTRAIEYFDAQSVKSVVCMVAFGCLGGHAYARGQARKLRDEYPHIDITILDYDPSASDINLINRTELVIQSARERME